MLVPLRKYKEKRISFSTTSEHYAAKCPFCSKKNTFWGGDINKIKIDGLNKCPHFSGVEGKKVNFRDDFDVLIDPYTNSIYINQVFFTRCTIKDLIYSLEEYDFEPSYYDGSVLQTALNKIYYYESEYGSNGRLKLLIKYLKNNPVIKYIENYEI